MATLTAVQAQKKIEDHLMKGRASTPTTPSTRIWVAATSKHVFLVKRWKSGTVLAGSRCLVRRCSTTAMDPRVTCSLIDLPAKMPFRRNT
ncbi:hypothetical protein [Pseudomonas asiatica]|uniref:hypothetical protein n=1 Tax=Pseudomonas asiatica TaxID=2219225 RepID=UPI001484ECED|nr:hypothetical protein [Pseudomonas asiatica]